MESDHRPPLGQRNSSQSSTRLNARARNASAKNLTKLSKITAAHGGAKVTMPRNTSKTNLRRNQSETSLQNSRNQGSNANNTGRNSSSSVAKENGKTPQTSNSYTTKRKSYESESGSKADPPPSYPAPQIPVDRSKQSQQKPARNKKRSSRDHTGSGGKKSKDQQPFDFDRDELFDDEAWVDEQVETVDSAEAADIPEGSTAHADEVQDIKDLPAAADEEDTLFSPSQVAQPPTAVDMERRVSFADEIPKQPYPNQTANPSIRIHPADSRSPPSTVLPPTFTDPNATSLHLERDIQAALQASQAADDSTKQTSPKEKESGEQQIPRPAAPKVQFAVGPTPSLESPETVSSTAKSELGVAASDSDTSRETVVLASKPQPIVSAMKPTSLDSDVPKESPPSTKKRPPKKVQIEEPPEEFDNLSNSNPSTGPATPSIPADTSAPATRTTSFTSFPQYEFLSKSQRDRASIMIQHHPFPPSAWRDNFLNRATPYINDVHSEYTQKFVRRLDRRVDNRLKNIMQFQDPLLDAIRRAQENGVIATFGPEDSASEMADTRSTASGIGGWFSRLGGSGRRDAPKPMSKEKLDAEQLDRWERLVQLYEWEVANSAKQAEVPERPLTAQTAGTEE